MKMHVTLGVNDFIIKHSLQWLPQLIMSQQAAISLTYHDNFQSWTIRRVRENVYKIFATDGGAQFDCDGNAEFTTCYKNWFVFNGLTIENEVRFFFVDNVLMLPYEY